MNSPGWQQYQQVLTTVHSVSLLADKAEQALAQQGLRQICCFWAGILSLVAATTAVLAQPLIEEQQRLSFGTLAITSNLSVSRFTYPRTGVNTSIDGQFVSIATGSPGSYLFTGFPAYTSLSVTLNTSTLAATGNGISELLSVDNYDFTELTTDAQGEAELALGARLNSSGNGGSYFDAPYSGSTVLRVDYWQPDVNAFVFNSKIIDMEVELRSTLTIEEEQQLSFGTLFARSSATDQATLTLLPSGSYSIAEPGDSRLVSLVKPNLGVVRVSGAAPNYSLQVTPQATDVLLQHTVSPGSSPHIILSTLVTSPNQNGTADTNGELLIKIGGTLKTELTALPVVYPAGNYEGTYQLTVSY